MLHLIITRFSVRFNLKLAKSDLLDPIRLAKRLDIFRNCCLPSILNQTDKNFKWIIIVDNELPGEIRRELEELVNPHEFIKIFTWDCENEKHKLGEINWLLEVPGISFTGTTRLAMTRLDDDDALNVGFVKYIRTIAAKSDVSKTPVIYSFPQGYISFNGVTKPFMMPFIALGMTLVLNPHICSINVYAFDHGKIKTAFRTRDYNYFRKFSMGIPNLTAVKTGEPMYIYFLHGENDSGVRYFGHLFKDKRGHIKGMRDAFRRYFALI